MHPTRAALLIACISACATASMSGAARAQSALLPVGPGGAYLTGPVRKALGQARATDFSRAASSVGFSTKETRAIAAGLREGRLTLVPPGPGAPGSKAETPLGAVPVTSGQQAALIRRTLEPAEYAWLFARYATIHIAVIPAPPRDYRIVINGESCQPTEASSYEVPPGHAIVSVTRTGKPPCAWAGAVASGQRRDVECRL